MYIRKGKPIFGYKDTFSLEHTLRPIIAAALIKYREVIYGNNRKGIPLSVMEALGIKDIHSKEDENKCDEYFNNILDELIWCFSTDEPKLSDYNFDFAEGEDHGKRTDDGNYLWDWVVTDEDEQERYNNDVALYHLRVQEGYNLFAKYFTDLWW